MKNTLSKFVIFAVGAAIGSAVTYKFVDVKFRRIAQEEIDSMKEYYNKKLNAINEDDIPEESVKRVRPVVKEKPDLMEYAKILQNEGYTDYAGTKTATKEDDDVDDIYVIRPEEYGEFHEYETINLTYYQDGVLADDMDEIVDDAEDIVGPDFADHFGEYEDDAVFVRNDARKCDYEICLVLEKYWDNHINPHQAEDE